MTFSDPNFFQYELKMEFFKSTLGSFFTSSEPAPILQEEAGVTIPPPTLPTTPPERCIITEMPIDIIHGIADFLPTQGRLILSMTCKALDRALYDRVYHERQAWTLEDYFQYLDLDGAGFPWWYPCHLRYDMHLTRLDDLPNTQNKYFQCPRADKLQLVRG